MRFLSLSAVISCCLGVLACGDDSSCVCVVGEQVPLCQEECSPTNEPRLHERDSRPGRSRWPGQLRRGRGGGEIQ